MKPYSETAVIGEAIEIEIDPEFNHLVVACSFFTSENKETIAAPTAGTVTIEGKVNGNSGWSLLDGSSLDATDSSSYASTSIPLSAIRATPSDLDVAEVYQITVTSNSH